MKQTTFNYIILGLLTLIIIGIALLYFRQPKQTDNTEKILIGTQKMIDAKLDSLGKILPTNTLVIREIEKKRKEEVAKLDSVQNEKFILDWYGEWLKQH